MCPRPSPRRCLWVDQLNAYGILTRHGFHGEWNYCLNPTADDTPDPNDLK